MTETLRIIQDKFVALTPEQREGFASVKTAQELEAALAGAGIELTDEEKSIAFAQILPPAACELSDEEAGKAAGGAGFAKCYYGHYESTGFASILGTSVHCDIVPCSDFKRKLVGPKRDGSKTVWVYVERCEFFSRNRQRVSDYSGLQTNWE